MQADGKENFISKLLSTDQRLFRPVELELLKGELNPNSWSSVDINKMKHDEHMKRGLIVETQKLESKEELNNYISKLFFYSALMNNFRTKIDWDAVENIIEGDFLNATN